MTDLGALAGGKWSEAVSINERGQVVGNSDSKIKQTYTASIDRPGHGFFWQAGKLTDLGTVGRGDRNSKAVAINDRGQVAAYSWHTVPDPSGEEVFDADFPHGFLWQNGKISERIGSDVVTSAPAAMNERGQVVGESYPREGLLARDPAWRAFRWQTGKSVDWYDEFSTASDINVRGQAIGDMRFGITEDGWEQNRAVLWEDGHTTSLGPLPGGEESSAYDINNKGQIVGSSRTTKKGEPWAAPRHAVLWTP